MSEPTEPSMEVGRKPDWKLSLVHEGKYYDIGGGWNNKSGTISIALDPYVSIPPQPRTKLMMIPTNFKK